MATQEEIAQIFPEMTNRFNASKAQGTNATILFDLSGENGGKFWVKIADGTVENGEGEVAADMTVRSSGDDFYALVSGNLNPMQAVMMGKVKVSDVQLGMKMIQIFQMGS